MTCASGHRQPAPPIGLASVQFSTLARAMREYMVTGYISRETLEHAGGANSEHTGPGQAAIKGTVGARASVGGSDDATGNTSVPPTPGAARRV